MALDADLPAWREFGSTPAPACLPDEAEVVIVGGGPVGLTLALDLGLRGRKVILLNRLTCIPTGSKAICFSKHSLETFDRLGIGQDLVDQGVTWQTGKVFWGESEEPVYEFDLLPVKHQKRPAFINLQQYRVEERLVAALTKLPNVEVRWGHEAIGIETAARRASVSVATAGGTYSVASQWVVACDGSRSSLRHMLGLDFAGRGFDDRFLIADIRMDQERPAERWFWFDPPFNPGGSALLHRQPDSLWRLDFQLDSSLSTEDALHADTVTRFVRGMIGPDVKFETVWTSVYKFRCCRMESFVHDRVLFAGDSAHVVSPFGARGCNGGIADAANLGWKLDLVLGGEAGPDLVESYNDEARIAADENIRNSSRSTDFIGPKTKVARALRDCVLELARIDESMRPWVNSGRLATAVHFGATSLSTPDSEDWNGGVRPGSPALDAPFRAEWLLDQLPQGFVLLTHKQRVESVPNCTVFDVGDDDAEATIVIDRYALQAGGAYLIRPDRYVAARWKSPDADAINRALRRARAGGKREEQRGGGGTDDSVDALFDLLLSAHNDLAPQTSEELNRRLVLLLLQAVGTMPAKEILSRLQLLHPVSS